MEKKNKKKTLFFSTFLIKEVFIYRRKEKRLYI